MQQLPKPPPVGETGGTCIICGKKVNAFYGTWGYYGNSGTCSRGCEDEQVKRSSFFFDGRV